MKVVILQQGVAVHAFDPAGRAWTVGRAPDNDIVLQDAGVSGHHAVLCWEGGALCARDLGSTNGTLHNGARLARCALGIGDVVRIGPFELRLLTGDAPPVAGFLVRVEGSAVAHAVTPGFSLPGHAEVVLFAEGGRLVLDDGEAARDVALGEPFELGGGRYVLEPRPEVGPTAPRGDLFPYALSVELARPRAVLEGAGRAPVEIVTEARVSLLYALARERGHWVDDDVVRTAVWGRGWRSHRANNLNVLVHRVRQQAHAGGYDRRFLQRRRNGLRLAVERAEVR